MRWRVKAVAVAAVTAVVTVAGCSQTVSGTARRAHPAVPDPERSYGYVDDRCGLLQDSSIQEMLGAENVVRPYSGAVCQYVLERDSAMVDVTFSSGSKRATWTANGRWHNSGVRRSPRPWWNGTRPFWRAAT